MTTKVMEPEVAPVTEAPPSVVDDLKRARGVLVEYGWCQGEYAKDAQGRSVDPDLTIATSFCALGAVRAALDLSDLMATSDAFGTALGLLARAAMAITGNAVIPNYNDRPGRTKAEVLQLFDRAIALAEAAEVGR